MNDAPIAPTPPMKRWWNLTRVEILVITAIVVVLLAILIFPGAQWVADGTREFPVQVFVFDVERGEPVPGAEVAVISRGVFRVYSVERAPQAANELVPLQDLLDLVPASQKGHTDEQGIASLVVEVRTQSSHRHPQPRAYPGHCWVVVSAPGFRGVVFPLSQEPVLTAELRERGGFLMPIGIMRDIAPAK
jgi:hypothetical protein